MENGMHHILYIPSSVSYSDGGIKIINWNASIIILNPQRFLVTAWTRCFSWTWLCHDWFSVEKQDLWQGEDSLSVGDTVDRRDITTLMWRITSGNDRRQVAEEWAKVGSKQEK